MFGDIEDDDPYKSIVVIKNNVAAIKEQSEMGMMIIIHILIVITY